MLLNAKGIIALNCLSKSTKLAKSIAKFKDLINNLTNLDLPSSRPITHNRTQLLAIIKLIPGNVKEVKATKTKVNTILKNLSLLIQDIIKVSQKLKKITKGTKKAVARVTTL